MRAQALLFAFCRTCCRLRKGDQGPFAPWRPTLVHSPAVVAQLSLKGGEAMSAIEKDRRKQLENDHPKPPSPRQLGCLPAAARPGLSWMRAVCAKLADAYAGAAVLARQRG